MDRISKAVNLLEAVLHTMDHISVVGVDNQSKFVGCAEAVQNASQMLTQFLATAEKSEGQEEVNGR